MEYTDDYKKELIEIIDLANTDSTKLTDRQAAILFHWVRHVNDIDYDWVPNKYKLKAPQYKGAQK